MGGRAPQGVRQARRRRALGRVRALGALLLPFLLMLPSASRGADVPAAAWARAAAAGEARVMVELAVAPRAPADAAGRARWQEARDAAQAALLARLGRGARARLRALPGSAWIAFDATPADLAALARAPEAVSVHEDRLLAPSLQTTVPQVGAAQAASAGFDGTGAAVAVIDTGIAGDHPFLAGKVVAEACFSGRGNCPNGQLSMVGPGAAPPCDWADLCFHGTHVAGAVAGAGAGLAGTAPGADLISLRVFSAFTGPDCAGAGEDPCALAYTSDMIAALAHAATLAASHTLGAVNMSLGGGLWANAVACEADPLNAQLKAEIDALRSLGIATVAAAGNDGATNGLHAPACISTALAVGAVDDFDAVWSGSNVSPDLDLLAPGVSVYSSAPPEFYGTAWLFSTGTSLAAAHVAGGLALLRQADPLASPDALEAALEATGAPVLDARVGATHPRLQVDLALKSLAPAACYNALDDDLDGQADYPDDLQCKSGLDASEATNPTCGLGPELPVLLAALASAHRSRRRRPPPAQARSGRPVST